MRILDDKSRMDERESREMHENLFPILDMGASRVISIGFAVISNINTWIAGKIIRGEKESLKFSIHVCMYMYTYSSLL